MNNPSMTFIGAGQMARSLISGLLNAHYPLELLSAVDPNENAQQWLKTHGVSTQFNSHAQIVILAIKPQMMASVVREYASQFAQQAPLIISIAAGIRLVDLLRWLNYKADLVRAMPNTPAKVACGVTGLYASAEVALEQRQWAEALFRATGEIVWCEQEAQLDAVTAISGSGPAYFFLFMECLLDAAKTLDLPEEVAKNLVYATASGAIRLAQHDAQNGVDLATLRRQVTSPGGTTEQALLSFQQQDLTTIVLRAVQAAHRRAGEISRDLGKAP